MARPKKYRRSVEAVMQADFVRIADEASIKYPYSTPFFYRMRDEGRIHTYGNPASIHCPEFEAAMKAGFPVTESENEAA